MGAEERQDDEELVLHEDVSGQTRDAVKVDDSDHGHDTMYVYKS